MSDSESLNQIELHNFMLPVPPPLKHCYILHSAAVLLLVEYTKSPLSLITAYLLANWSISIYRTNLWYQGSQSIWMASICFVTQLLIGVAFTMTMHRELSALRVNKQRKRKLWAQQFDHELKTSLTACIG